MPQNFGVQLKPCMAQPMYILWGPAQVLWGPTKILRGPAQLLLCSAQLLWIKPRYSGVKPEYTAGSAWELWDPARAVQPQYAAGYGLGTAGSGREL
jgi:hypothetical protein